MNLLSILKKYKKEDVTQMEQESLFSKDSNVGLSTTEKWELEKIKDKPRDFFSFHKEMSSQSFEIEK